MRGRTARHVFGRTLTGEPAGRSRHETLLFLSLSTLALRLGGFAGYFWGGKRSEEEEETLRTLAAVLLLASLPTEALAMAVGMANAARNREWRWLACIAAFGTLATTPYAMLRRRRG